MLRLKKKYYFSFLLVDVFRLYLLGGYEKHSCYTFINSKKYIFLCLTGFFDSMSLNYFDLFYIIKRERIKSSVLFTFPCFILLPGDHLLFCLVHEVPKGRSYSSAPRNL